MHPLRHAPSPFSAGKIARGLLCAALGFAAAEAQNPSPVEEPAAGEPEEELGFLQSNLLPDGSILKGVTLPSYSRNLKLTSEVKADELVIVSEDRINAKNLLIEMYDAKEVQSARVAMRKARFLPAKKMLISDEPVSIISNKLTADGSALVFDTAKRRGFLHGPVKAVTELDLKTSMNAQPVRTAFATGALLMAGAHPLPAQAPKEPTAAERFAELRLKPEELAKISEESASKKEQLSAHDEAAEKAFGQAQEQAEGARVTMNDFFRTASLTALMAEPAPAPATGDVPAPDLPDNPLKTTITAKDGAYFDSIAGLAIFLKQVEVKNPELQLSGADELKVFMEPKSADEDRSKEKAKGSPESKIPDPNAPEGSKPKPQESEAKPVVEKTPPTPEMLEQMRAAKEKAKQLGQEKKGDFGSAKRLVATGPAVRINYKSASKTKDGKEQEMIMASGRTLIYDIEKEQIILRGGSPWVMKGDQMQRVVGEDAYILIYTQNGEPTKIVTGNQELFEGEFSTPPKADDKKAKNQTPPKNQSNPKPQNPKNR
ncbi:hypothetical protein [Luteolibacter luteus]|uniref:Organic solvent tolerance-like N-terminal domain-containing protein n=1 Tax=Luteolibacter luteus TaxID=2728835 RepID=A0A858RKW5_9BACT|nr:hypothetical protein [Luteolibacter luteus]QJE97241.1 hypothetical protein HHL09_16075 [Luteolibacter luteus]